MECRESVHGIQRLQIMSLYNRQCHERELYKSTQCSHSYLRSLKSDLPSLSDWISLPFLYDANHSSNRWKRSLFLAFFQFLWIFRLYHTLKRTHWRMTWKTARKSVRTCSDIFHTETVLSKNLCPTLEFGSALYMCPTVAVLFLRLFWVMMSIWFGGFSIDQIMLNVVNLVNLRNCRRNWNSNYIRQSVHYMQYIPSPIVQIMVGNITSTVKTDWRPSL